MPSRLLPYLAAAVAIGLVLPAGAQDTPPPGDLMRVAFVGELLDETDRPISGVFPLTFNLLRSQSAEAPVWSETQYVAVFEGMYEVQLGRRNGIPAAWAGEQRVLEVALGDAGALTRQVVVLVPWTPDAAAPQPTIRHERYVDLAGRAVDADRAAIATDCRTLSGQAAGTLDHYDELRRQLDEVRARVDSPAGNRIGRDSVTLTPIGGTGGLRYERNCPPGFVMTGVRGGAGELIDGLRIICTQLE